MIPLSMLINPYKKCICIYIYNIIMIYIYPINAYKIHQVFKWNNPPWPIPGWWALARPWRTTTLWRRPWNVRAPCWTPSRTDPSQVRNGWKSGKTLGLKQPSHADLRCFTVVLSNTMESFDETLQPGCIWKIPGWSHCISQNLGRALFCC